MPPKNRQPERRPARPVTITAVVDPVAALASENLDAQPLSLRHQQGGGVHRFRHP